MRQGLGTRDGGPRFPRRLSALGPLSLVLVVFISGCGGPPDLMPLEVGKSWTYSVSTTFKPHLAQIRIPRKTSVAGTDGFVLSGPMGETHLAWKDGVLVADRFSNTYFSPAAPLLVDVEGKVRREWRGSAQGLWGKMDATAVLNQAPAEEILGGRKIKVIKTELTITGSKGKSIKLQTMFQPGAGIATQRQWIDGKLLVRLERMSGS